ncbi:MAG: type II toxin-antitoxin system PemK/MazF family toxin [Candidatus Moeniiplasma glomeromycotorum]|nr:type II toxin-antitoxin system PemK/MazF family toxin [Candidatus Moeniiplasma glomeromycotorum]MCE8169704.1 type II toxin-antitoxin system PemK/MazF family toxin [Candidatus Moeniiplasma glomeromycotorum]
MIISNDEQNEISRRVMAIPLTSRQLPSSTFHVKLIFQGKLARILTEQMRVVDKSRIKVHCGKVNRKILK